MNWRAYGGMVAVAGACAFAGGFSANVLFPMRTVSAQSDVLVEFDDDFRVRPDDALYVCGSIMSLDRYQQAFHVTTAQSSRA